MPFDPSALGQNIRTHRLSLSLTQAELDALYAILEEVKPNG